MLENCEDCIDGVLNSSLNNTNGIEIPCDDFTRAECIIINEDLNLCSVNLNNNLSLSNFIIKIDELLCNIKNNSIGLIFDDIDVTGSCIKKELITDIVTGKKTIKLSLDKDCIIDIIEDSDKTHPYIISTSKITICGDEKATLTSNVSNAKWYNQSQTLIGEGSTIQVSTTGSYYSIANNKISNVINIVHNINCDVFSFTKVKNFYANCPAGTKGLNYTFSKIYTSTISYSDAINQSNIDANNFDFQGQTIANSINNCIPIDGNTPTPINSDCFTVILSDVNCNSNTPTPNPSPVITPNPTTPNPSPTAPNPVTPPVNNQCIINLQVSNIVCSNNTPNVPNPTPNVPSVPSPAPSPDNEQPVEGFVNNLKSIPYETLTDTFNANLWENINTKLKTFDSQRQFPKYVIVWHHKLLNFANANKRWHQLGIPFATDKNPDFGGHGRERCVDWIRYFDGNTGQPYKDNQGNITDIDPLCQMRYWDFISATPFEYRAFADGGRVLPINSLTNDELYNIGNAFVTSAEYGYGDNVNGKTNNGLVLADVEVGDHGAFEEIPIMIGMTNNTMGITINHYGQSVNISNPRLSHYPLNYISGGYVINLLDIDGTELAPVQNVITELWKPQNKVSIPSKNIVNKGVVDYPNIWECSEVSSYAGSTYRQGETIYYDNDNPNLSRIINKFGVNRNTEHVIAHTIYGVEVRKWHLRKNYNNRPMVTMAKILADRGLIGNTNFNGKFGHYIDNENLKALHHDRRASLGLFMFCAIQGSHYLHWDRNSENRDIDGIHGLLQGVNLINTNIDLGGGIITSFVDEFENFDYKLWTSEISYDGGNTWLQEKGIDYILNPQSIPYRSAITSNGIWAFYLHRNENTERTSCKIRINYQGVNREFNITSDMWETTNPQYQNTALSQIPNSDKDFIFKMVNLNLSSTPNPVTPVTPVPNPTPITPIPNPVNSNITITEPIKSQYYFSNGQAPSFYDNVNNFPAIHRSGTRNYSNYSGKIVSDIYMQSNYDPVNDIVWMSNDKIKIGINLLRGGQIAWASLLNDTSNLVYNGYDGGFQVTIDAYQRRDGYTQNGKVSRKNFDSVLQYSNQQNTGNPLFSYNTTMGGDFNNNSQSLISYQRIGNSYIVKFRPIFYSIDAEYSQVYIQVKYTLDGYSVKCEYEYKSFRTDGQWDGAGIDNCEVPACFFVNQLNKYQIYTGNNPFNNDNLQDGVLPIQNLDQPPLGITTKERFAIVYNPNNNKTIGVFSPLVDGNEQYFILKQLEVVPGESPGTEFTGGFTYMGASKQLVGIGQSVDRGNLTKNYISYLMITPSPQIARQEAYRLNSL